MTDKELEAIDALIHEKVMERSNREAMISRYSADIAAAWRVVEGVVHSGKYIHDEKRDGMADCRLLFNPYERTWECKFSWSSSYEVKASDHCPCVAICKAALKALEAKS